jgi:hypothetical protein
MKKWRHHALNNCVGIGELSIALYYNASQSEIVYQPIPFTPFPWQGKGEVMERDFVPLKRPINTPEASPLLDTPAPAILDKLNNMMLDFSKY